MEDPNDGKTSTGFVDRFTLGIIRVLENLPGVEEVCFPERAPAEKRCLVSWEQKNNCVLPEDLKDFYLTSDGFSLTWSCKLEQGVVPVGRMTINSIAQLRPLIQLKPYTLPNAPTLADLDSDEDSEGPSGLERPRFDSRSRIFELDPCGGQGRVCLVYGRCSLGVMAERCELWFLDRSLFWHFLSPSFSTFYRLMISQLGLPQWQYNFTPYGPGPRAQQWAALYQPLTFCPNAGAGPVRNTLDPDKAFRGKTESPTPKKKQPASGKQQALSSRHALTRR